MTAPAARHVVPRPELARIPFGLHGGPRGDEDGGDIQRIDFSVSLNAFGPADTVRTAVRDARIADYPDPQCLIPRRAASVWCGVPVGQLAIGAGTTEFIHAVCLAFIRLGDIILTPPHCYGEYARAATIVGGRPQSWRTRHREPADDEALLAAAVIADVCPRIVFLCAPENPSGRCWPLTAIRVVADACSNSGSLLVLDQAYDAFAAQPLGTPALPGHPAVLHLRSLTKEHALAGVRVGIAIGPTDVIAALERVRMPWSVSSAAQAATVAALSEAAASHVQETIPILRAEAGRLADAAAASGIETALGGTHVILLHVSDATAIRRWLLTEYRIKVRDCTSFGLPHTIRVAARTPRDNEELIDTFPRFRPFEAGIT